MNSEELADTAVEEAKLEEGEDVTEVFIDHMGGEASKPEDAT